MTEQLTSEPERAIALDAEVLCLLCRVGLRPRWARLLPLLRRRLQGEP